MNAAQVLDHFDRMSDAPDAISRLRRFILDLAVRGKLIEQDPNDEPAPKLIDRIRAEKVNLVSDGKIKGSEPVWPSIKVLPYQLPEGWEFVQLQSVCISVADGDHLPPPKTSQGIPFLVIGNVRNRSIDFTGCRHVSEEYFNTVDSSRRPRRGDILYTLVGSFGIPIMVVDDRSFCVQRHIGILRPSKLLDSVFLSRVMESRFVFDQAAACATGIAQKTVPLSGLRRILLPLPPLDEQQRIVAKVGELMALCDRLETAQAERESRRDKLVAASLHGLNTGTDADEFREHSRFHLRHLPRLTTRPEHIQQLRQTILNLAVRGKLVRQDPNDQSSQHLLEEIEAERRVLKVLSEAFNKAMFSELAKRLLKPSNWAVEPLAKVALRIVDCPHSTPKWTELGKICVRTNQFRPGKLDLSDSRFVSETSYLERIERLAPLSGDILYSREGGILGVACRIPPDTQLCMGQRMMLIRPPVAMNPVFLEMVLNSPLIVQIAREKTTGGAAPRVNVATVKAYPIPIPPYSEQQRIVAKVDELMILCDQLEAELIGGQTESHRLLETVLHENLEPAHDNVRRGV